MKKITCLIFALLLIVNIANATPLLWRGAKAIPAGTGIFMGGFGYSTTTRSWGWANEEWTDLPDVSQTDVISGHFMLGYTPIDKWELMVHVPVMYKSKDTLSSMGLQDMWVKTRYQFVGGKDQPFFTGTAAVRIPTSSEDLDISLDDRTLDIAVGALFMYKMVPVIFHLKAGYWYNMKNDADIDVGDQIEAIFKIDYVFNKQIKAFLNFSFMETMQAKDSSGTSLDNSQKRRLNIIPGLVATPAKGLSLRPKFTYPLEMVNQGGSNFAWKIGFDVWYVVKF